jgi:glycolate oxidase FAD binding subunit
MLAFEPPLHTEHATFGGAIATGLSGPRRAYSGAARDFVLGTTVINGKGEILKFGGQVMKNVAGYDVSRLMTGAQGTLGVLLDISVKVLPVAEKEITLMFELDQQTAHDKLRQWTLQGHAVSASCFIDNILSVRLSSTESSVNHSISELGGEKTDNNLWIQLRHQTHPFFTDNTRLWRLSVPPATEPVLQDHKQLIEWGGALRWIASEDPVYEQAAALNGHATRYALNTNKVSDPFQPLGPTLLKLHKQLKQAFDPGLILNPGRTYSGL